MKDKNKNKCLYCKYADCNEDYLESDIRDDVESYLICTIQDNKQVEDDDICKEFKFNKKVYDEINC